MYISDRQRAVLALCELDPDIPVRTIARKLKLREHTVRYEIRSFEVKGVTHRLPIIDLYRLGFTYHIVYFSLGMGREDDREAFLRQLVSYSEVVWVAEFIGRFQYGVCIAARRLHEVHLLLSQITAKYSRPFFDKAFLLRTRIWFTPRSYLSAKAPKRHVMLYGRENPVAIDSLDESILSQLEGPRSLSLREIARAVGSPHTTVEYRLRNLRSSEVLNGMRLMLNAGLLNIVESKLLITARGGGGADLTRKLLDFAEAHPNVIALLENAGEWDYELNLESERSADIMRVIRELSALLGEDISRIEVLTLLRTRKHVPFRGAKARVGGAEEWRPAG